MVGFCFIWSLVMVVLRTLETLDRPHAMDPPDDGVIWWGLAQVHGLNGSLFKNNLSLFICVLF